MAGGVPETRRGRRRDLGEPRNSSGNVWQVQSCKGEGGAGPLPVAEGVPRPDSPLPSSLGQFRGPGREAEVTASSLEAGMALGTVPCP